MKKIAVVTSSRAEYGILFWVLKRLQHDKGFTLQLIVSGSHLAPAFGHTIDFIQRDGFKIAAQVAIVSSDDSPMAMALATGKGICRFSEVFDELRPDLLLVLGDRFEIFAAAYAARVFNIPIIHIGGGDTTEGAIDDCLRHSISLMSQLHLVKLESHRQRLLSLGIPSRQISVVGSLGLENMARLECLSRATLEKQLNLPLDPSALITFHPVTIPKHTYDNHIEHALDALSSFKHLNCVFTASNQDAGGRRINEAIARFCHHHPGRTRFLRSVGQQVYLSLMARCSVMIGNSSSGLLEAGSFQLPVVNIAPRQDGREHSQNVITTENKRPMIRRAIKVALSDEFRKTCQTVSNIYEVIPPREISRRVVDIIKKRFL